MHHSDSAWDVIVVGAGLAGLKAALELKAAGKRVLVVEARDRVGGRAKAGEIRGRTVDLGGQWVGPEQKLLLAQARALGVKTCPQYAEGESLLGLHGRISRYKGDIPRLPLLALLELDRIDRRWKRDANSLPQGAPWRAARAAQWDAQSVESWITRNIRTRAARDSARVVTRAVFCAEPAQVSYLFFLEILRQGHGLASLIGVEGGAQQDKFIGGAWQIARRMAERLEGGVILNSPVQAVEQDADGVRVFTASGSHAARHLVMAVPAPLASRIHYNAPLPAKRDALLQRLPMGAVIKVHVAYETPFWRQRGLNGAVASDDHHLSIVFDNSPEDQSLGLLVGLIEADHAVAMSPQGEEARRRQVISDLVDYFGEQAAQPLAYIDCDWTAEPWSRGGYVAYMAPGAMTGFGDIIREPCGRIHWAGTETATEWMGYLDGALQSGMRAAAEIAQAGA